MAPVDSTYYNLLDVSVGCTEADLRSAYKKKALRLHPDKGGDPEDFRKMKSAYDVLIDPNRRKIYDKYGSEGLQMMEGNMRPEAMMVVLSRSGKCAMFAFFICMTVSVLSPILLFALKWDEAVDWPWYSAFIPLWFFHFVLLVAVCALIRAPTPEKAEAEWDAEMRADYKLKKRAALTARIQGTVINLLLITVWVFLALKLEGDVDWSWFIVALPWLFFEICLLITNVVSAPRAWEKAKLEYLRLLLLGKSHLPPSGFCYFLFLSLIWGFIRILTLMLLAARADELISDTWFICFIPIMIACFFKISRSCCRKLALDAAKAKRVSPQQEAHSDPEEQHSDVTGACCVVGFWLIILCGASTKLDGNEYSAFIVFLPFLILIVCCFCLLPSCVVATQFQNSPEEAAAAAAAAARQAQSNSASTQDTDLLEVTVTCHPHPLKKFDNGNTTWYCDQQCPGCTRRSEGPKVRWSCRECGYDLCRGCVEGHGGKTKPCGSEASKDAKPRQDATAPMDTAPTPDTNPKPVSKLEPGQRVRMHGLQGAKELNGTLGTCEHFVDATGRWSVRLESGDVKAFKAENLQVVNSNTTWVCQCGHDNPHDNTFCGKCGAKNPASIESGIEATVIGVSNAE